MDFLKKLFASENDSCNKKELTNSLPEMSNESISKEIDSEGPGMYRLRANTVQESCFMPFPGFYNRPLNDGNAFFIDDSSELRGLGNPLSKYDEYLYKGNCPKCKNSVCQCNNKGITIDCSPQFTSTNSRTDNNSETVPDNREFIPFGCGGNFTSFNLNNIIGENTREIARKECKDKRTNLAIICSVKLS